MPPARSVPPERSSVETLKISSNGLRGRIAEELARDGDHFEEAEKQLIKFHGLYQQDDRDRRGGGKAYSFLIRSRIPGGKLSAAQYLVHDGIAEVFGNGTLRITTRQDFQLHGVLKGDLKATLQTLHQALLTTIGACGDVVRNVVYPPVPITKAYEAEIERVALQVSDGLLPRTRAYHEIWLDGEKLDLAEPEPVDPLYRDAYLPRKFKVGFAFPGDNSIDVFTQDVGLIPVTEADALVGFNVVVGGGLGMTHKKPDTFPRLADPLGFVTVDEAFEVVRTVVEIQRDHGDRVNRKTARLKYLIHRWGIERFREEVISRLGRPLQSVREVAPLKLDLYLGWHRQADDRWYLGISVENGRIADTSQHRLRTAIHSIVSRFGPDVALTPNQDILLTGIQEPDRAPIEAILQEHGVRLAGELSNARKYAMACPALPTCPLAVAESERVFPGVIDQLEHELDLLNLGTETFTVRMTGCPNGCARPYVADVGFVGRSADNYMIFLGGREDGTRLNTPFRDLVPRDRLVPTLAPLLASFASDRLPEETFGDYCARLGPQALDAISPREDRHAAV